MALTLARNDRPVDARAGGLRIRLAETGAKLEAALGLRYRGFCEEMAAKPVSDMVAAGREFDSFDSYCDHLLVFGMDRETGVRSVVGTTVVCIDVETDRITERYYRHYVCEDLPKNERGS